MLRIRRPSLSYSLTSTAAGRSPEDVPLDRIPDYQITWLYLYLAISYLVAASFSVIGQVSQSGFTLMRPLYLAEGKVDFRSKEDL